MGRLADFRYHEITRKLKSLGLQFDRQAAGSHEIWSNPGHQSVYNYSKPSWRDARGYTSGNSTAG